MKDDEKGGAKSMHGRYKKCVQHFGWKPEGKRPLGKPGNKWQNNIKMDIKETMCRVDSQGTIQGKVAGFCEYGNEPWGSIK
jgi:hypothetical protein